MADLVDVGRMIHGRKEIRLVFRSVLAWGLMVAVSLGMVLVREGFRSEVPDDSPAGEPGNFEVFDRDRSLYPSFQEASVRWG